MMINQIILLSIVASVFACYDVQMVTNDVEFNSDQFKGRWFEMGKISTCVDDARSCSTYEIGSYDDGKLMCSYVPIENVPNCSHGAPIYHSDTSDFIRNRSILNAGFTNQSSSSTYMFYNNGTELIFVGARNRKCRSLSYRLWSRKREVSEETKAEFEKLAGNATVRYYAWENCPKLRIETDDEFTVEQVEGLWYSIALVHYGPPGIQICSMLSATVDYENQTFNLTENSIKNGGIVRETAEGRIIESVLHWNEMSIDSNSTDVESVAGFAISCNNGTELLWRVNDLPYYFLLSRNPEVSEETMVQFKKLTENFAIYEDFNLIVCPRDIFPKNIN